MNVAIELLKKFEVENVPLKEKKYKILWSEKATHLPAYIVQFIKR